MMMVDCVCGVRHQVDRERLTEPKVIAGVKYFWVYRCARRDIDVYQVR